MQGLPVLTDVHEPAHCGGGGMVDVLQIRRFFAGRPICCGRREDWAGGQYQEGQFVAPWVRVIPSRRCVRPATSGYSMTERGASFGYNAVVDYRSLP
jgi:2-dehydro-3-deoxyphosphooctonate aldolase (KDO 8-P synthase)